jgi:hypothetical protein
MKTRHKNKDLNWHNGHNNPYDLTLNGGIKFKALSKEELQANLICTRQS